MEELLKKEEDSHVVTIAENVLVWMMENLMEFNERIEDVNEYKNAVASLIGQGSKIMLDSFEKSELLTDKEQKC